LKKLSYPLRNVRSHVAGVRSYLERYGSYYFVGHTADVQCESKNLPCGFLTFFSQTGGNFLINFYTPITRSFLHWSANLYSIISNFDEVMPYFARPPNEFLHFTRSLTSKFAY